MFSFFKRSKSRNGGSASKRIADGADADDTTTTRNSKNVSEMTTERGEAEEDDDDEEASTVRASKNSRAANNSDARACALAPSTPKSHNRLHANDQSDQCCVVAAIQSSQKRNDKSSKLQHIGAGLGSILLGIGRSNKRRSSNDSAGSGKLLDQGADASSFSGAERSLNGGGERGVSVETGARLAVRDDGAAEAGDSSEGRTDSRQGILGLRPPAEPENFTENDRQGADRGAQVLQGVSDRHPAGPEGDSADPTLSDLSARTPTPLSAHYSCVPIAHNSSTTHHHQFDAAAAMAKGRHRNRHSRPPPQPAANNSGTRAPSQKRSSVLDQAVTNRGDDHCADSSGRHGAMGSGPSSSRTANDNAQGAKLKENRPASENLSETRTTSDSEKSEKLRENALEIEANQKIDENVSENGTKDAEKCENLSEKDHAETVRGTENQKSSEKAENLSENQATSENLSEKTENLSENVLEIAAEDKKLDKSAQKSSDNGKTEKNSENNTEIAALSENLSENCSETATEAAENHKLSEITEDSSVNQESIENSSEKAENLSENAVGFTVEGDKIVRKAQSSDKTREIDKLSENLCKKLVENTATNENISENGPKTDNEDVRDTESQVTSDIVENSSENQAPNENFNEKTDCLSVKGPDNAENAQKLAENGHESNGFRETDTFCENQSEGGTEIAELSDSLSENGTETDQLTGNASESADPDADSTDSLPEAQQNGIHSLEIEPRAEQNGSEEENCQSEGVEGATVSENEEKEELKSVEMDASDAELNRIDGNAAPREEESPQTQLNATIALEIDEELSAIPLETEKIVELKEDRASDRIGSAEEEAKANGKVSNGASDDKIDEDATRGFKNKAVEDRNDKNAVDQLNGTAAETCDSKFNKRNASDQQCHAEEDDIKAQCTENAVDAKRIEIAVPTEESAVNRKAAKPQRRVTFAPTPPRTPSESEDDDQEETEDDETLSEDIFYDSEQPQDEQRLRILSATTVTSSSSIDDLNRCVDHSLTLHGPPLPVTATNNHSDIICAKIILSVDEPPPAQHHQTFNGHRLITKPPIVMIGDEPVLLPDILVETSIIDQQQQQQHDSDDER